MKNAILALLVILAPSLASAAPAEVITAVLNSDAFKQTIGGNRNISEIKETAVYRCPGCFTIQVTIQEKRTETKSFNTRMIIGDGQRSYVVSAAEGLSSDASTGGRCGALGRVAGEDVLCAQHKTKTSCESRDHWERCFWEAN